MTRPQVITVLRNTLTYTILAYCCWWVTSDRTAAEPKLPAGFEKYAATSARIQPLYEKKRPNQPGDWLENNKEAGQTFAEYVQWRKQKPIRSEFTTIYVLPLGEFDHLQEKIVEQTVEFMQYFFGVPVQQLPVQTLGNVPAEARRQKFDHEQLEAGWIQSKLILPKRPKDAVAVIGLVPNDLWAGNLNFVFGQASLIERTGVWSLYRNGDPRLGEKGYRLCLLRTLKTAAHETGHMLGIPHCIHYECCMNGCNNRDESDRHPLEFCPECQAKIWWTCGAEPLARTRLLLDFATDQGLSEAHDFWEKQVEILQR